ncbi:YiiX/YebB-like N1pC/P60 family cysteine hydrolase [Deefgea rivuli]|uniref:YiiX/YebB-like N1pC/P60 family cysteine hydrolase n=1 Tax=Deefgea rivuli TaxID=400948 RepID=UPI000482430A|nr:YiiX/YebB-like N1pC/P60 family cysteine hydrolase [Deefgea rivuli]
MEDQIRRFLIRLGTIALLGWISFLLITTWSDRRHQQTAPISLYQTISLNSLPNGALLFRRGKSTESDAVVMSKDGSKWSHVGLIASGANGITVIHAVPAEEYGKPDVVKEDQLQYFLADERAVDAAVMRVNGVDDKEAEAAVQAARRMIGMPFSIHPENKTTNGIYCTELVLLAWQAAGITLTELRDNVQFPFFSGQYLLPDTLASSNWLRPAQLLQVTHQHSTD